MPRFVCAKKKRCGHHFLCERTLEDIETGFCRAVAAYVVEMSGAPGEIRTPGLLVRSQTLYPAELRAHTVDGQLL